MNTNFWQISFCICLFPKLFLVLPEISSRNTIKGSQHSSWAESFLLFDTFVSPTSLHSSGSFFSLLSTRTPRSIFVQSCSFCLSFLEINYFKSEVDSGKWREHRQRKKFYVSRHSDTYWFVHPPTPPHVGINYLNKNKWFSYFSLCGLFPELNKSLIYNFSTSKYFATNFLLPKFCVVNWQPARDWLNRAPAWVIKPECLLANRYNCSYRSSDNRKKVNKTINLLGAVFSNFFSCFRRRQFHLFIM